MKWIVFSLFTLVFWVVLYLYFYLGVSQPVVIDQFQTPEQLLVYKDHLGAYHKINDTIQAVEDKLNDLGFSCTLTFGQYLDDPNKVEEDRLRSQGGCLFEHSTLEVQKRLSDLLHSNQDIKFQLLPSRNAVRAIFKGAPAIGPFKVYPKMDEYIQQHRLARIGAILEIYEVSGSKVTTTYLQPVP